ncbi:MAG: hypothetical protein AMJ90_08465 [candidate division Zixibacteria bacterium SM23_73_2]|nr:MAG: hypothetical protein AMJ90_08465 [candidate division Zixibacteria bacterium SM23_73_2]
MQFLKETLLLFLSLFILLFILRFKPKYLSYYPKNFKLLTLGFLIFSATFGVKLLSKIFLFYPNPYFKTAEICGLVLGTLVCISGIIHLLHWGKRLNLDFKDKLRQLNCIKILSSLSEKATSTDELLKEAFTQIMSTMRYGMGVLYKNSLNSSEFSLSAYWQVPSERIQLLYSLPEENSFFREGISTKETVTQDEISALPEYNRLFFETDKISSFACVPIRFKDKVHGIIGIYDQRPQRFTYDETLYLSGLGKLLGVMTERSLVCKRNKWRRAYISVGDEFTDLILSGFEIEETFPKMAKLLKKIVDFDYISLAVMDSSGKNMGHLSMAGEWNLLLNRRRSLPTQGTLVEKVKNSNEPLIKDDVSPDTLPDDTLIKASGIRSILALPLSRNGVLTFGSVKAKNYQPEDARWLKLICSLFDLFLLKSDLKEELSSKEEKLTRLNGFAKKSLEEKDLQKIFDYAAENITCGLPASLCRVSVLSEERFFTSETEAKKEEAKSKRPSPHLLSLSSHKIREGGIDLQDKKRFLLSELPWHRFALEAKRPVLVNQDDPESIMSEEEAGLLMDQKINSALLVPLVVDQKPFGVISVGEMRNWDRKPFSKDEIDFLEAISFYLGLAVKRMFIQKPDSKKEDAPEKFYELSLKINNCLSSILGSAELIQKKKDFTDEENLKYLKTIQKNSQRIKKELTGFSTATIKP